MSPRPPNAQEIAERAPQVIQCNDTLKEVTLYQNTGGKQMSRTFRYDKVQPTALLRQHSTADAAALWLQRLMATAVLDG